MNARIENYLKVYNTLQLSGWILAALFLFINMDVAYSCIFIFQLLSLAEIFHAVKKWNNSSPLFCTLQIFARLLILYLVMKMIFSMGGNFPVHFVIAIYALFTAWCIAEIARYAYYLSVLKHAENKILTWMRYNAFIICYPVGLICEVYFLLLVFGFTPHAFLKIVTILVLLLYTIAFPALYLHLLKQRSKKLKSTPLNIHNS